MEMLGNCLVTVAPNKNVLERTVNMICACVCARVRVTNRQPLPLKDSS